MKRTGLIALAALCLFAETSRDAYRAAYRQWREADPNLERDSGSLSAQLAGRVDAVAARAAKYGSERSAYLRQSAADQEQSLAWLAVPIPAPPDAPRVVRDNVASETAVVKRNLDTFSKDPDPGIQLLRAALERENVALAALANSVAERQSAADALKSSAADADQARAKAAAAEHDLSGLMTAAAEQSDRESAAWADYYRKLAASAKGEAPLPVPTAPVPTARPAITPLPLVRYTGAWTFPTGGLFHGTAPEFLDLVVHESNGHVDGTLFARFKVAPGGKDDPVLRFDFAGDLKNTRNQVFPLETSDGAKGTIELIPGPAFNLLEVNFQTEPKPGKIRQGNVVLVKK
ncbi:MAG: hypothetical protein LAO79_10805 [Acidobacteriia bacterium]|nr:hypothetical protein [Terriglobia bacterium]